jgi:hypothetical protein
MAGPLRHFQSARDKQRYEAGDKVEMTMHEWKHGTLHSGSKTGPKVRNRKQAIAIALSQAKKAGQR